MLVLSFLTLIIADIVIAIHYLVLNRQRLKLSRHVAIIVIVLCIAAGFVWNQERNFGGFLFVSAALAAPVVVLVLRVADANERRNHIRPFTVLLTFVQLVLGAASSACLVGLWDLFFNGWS